MAIDSAHFKGLFVFLPQIRLPAKSKENKN